MPVVSEEDLVAYCDASTLGSSAAALLVELETYAVATIERSLGIYLGDAAAVTEYLDGGTARIYLRQVPISLTSVSTGAPDSWAALEASSYRLSGSRVLSIDGSIFPEGVGTVRAIYQAGYNGAAWQLPLRRLILNTVNWMARVGRKASVEDILAAGPNVPGWNETMALYRRPLYG